MFLGHYELALAAGSAAPDESLGAAVARAQRPCLIWPVRLPLGFDVLEETGSSGEADA